MTGTGLFGVYRGTITSGADPLNQGRAQVTVPALGIGGAWAPVCRDPGAARSAPRPGSACVVAFEGGNPQYPVVLGVTG